MEGTRQIKMRTKYIPGRKNSCHRSPLVGLTGYAEEKVNTLDVESRQSSTEAGERRPHREFVFYSICKDFPPHV